MKIDTTNSRLCRLEKKLDQHDQRFDGIDKKLDMHGKDIKSLKNDVGGIKGDIKSLGEKIDKQYKDFENHTAALYEKFQHDLSARLEFVGHLIDDVSELKSDMKIVKNVLGIRSRQPVI